MNTVNQEDNSGQFVSHLTESQSRLYGYIFSLVGDHNRAADLVQETNLVLWQKKDEFRTGQPFIPWAFAIARFRVLAWLRDNSRDRLLLDSDLANTICTESERMAQDIELVQQALRPCIKQLTTSSQELIEYRYFRSMPIATIAESLSRSATAIKTALFRIRRQLTECVGKKLEVDQQW